MKSKIILFIMSSMAVFIFLNLFKESAFQFNYLIEDKDFKTFLISKYQKDYNCSRIEAVSYVNDLYKNNKIHGLDLNNDGILEIEVGGGYNCYVTSCAGDYYLKTNTSYRLIFDGGWIVALDTYTNGFRDLRYNPNDIGPCTTFGWSCDKLSHYKYNGSSYQILKNEEMKEGIEYD